MDAGMLLGRRRIDGYDARMREGALQEPGPQHARQDHVAGIARAASYFEAPLQAVIRRFENLRHLGREGDGLGGAHFFSANMALMAWFALGQAVVVYSQA